MYLFQKDKETVLLVHGYAGSAFLFYRIFKELAANFHVYMIDLLGMGR